MNAARIAEIIAQAGSPERAAEALTGEFIMIRRDPEAAERLALLRGQLRRSGHSV